MRRLLLLPVVVWLLAIVFAFAVGDPAKADQAAKITFHQSAVVVDAYDFVEVTIDVARPAAAGSTDAATTRWSCSRAMATWLTSLPASLGGP